MLEQLIATIGADTVAVHLDGVPARDRVVAACERMGKTVVALDANARVVITADGVVECGVVRQLKDEVDAVAPGAECVIVIRHLGAVPLAPTLDAYLDVEMIDGRDLWAD